MASVGTKKIITIGSLSALFIFLIAFAFFGARDLIFGVRIKNVNLQDGATLRESTLKVQGNAKNAIMLILNGREISVDEAGNFNETIALLSGYNVINIKAKDKFNTTDEKNYNLIYTGI